MNAYELAEKLYLSSMDTYHEEAANMLRQQADRIAELESCLDFALQDTMDYIRLNNLGGENNHWLTWARKLLVNTTPQTKPLSDEEIIDIALSLKIAEDNIESNWGNAVIELVKTIEKRHGIK